MGYPNTCPDCGGHFDPGHTCPTPGGAVGYLQRQLQQAQEERKCYWEAYRRAFAVAKAMRVCRDAARAERDAAIGRAEAAEMDAAEQWALAEETVRLRDAVWAMQEWWRVSRDEIWAERKGTIEFILGQVHQCVFCRKSLGPQENKDSQGGGWWGCWPPCQPRAEAQKESD